MSGRDRSNWRIVVKHAPHLFCQLLDVERLGEEVRAWHQDAVVHDGVARLGGRESPWRPLPPAPAPSYRCYKLDEKQKKEPLDTVPGEDLRQLAQLGWKDT